MMIRPSERAVQPVPTRRLHFAAIILQPETKSDGPFFVEVWPCVNWAAVRSDSGRHAWGWM